MMENQNYTIENRELPLDSLLDQVIAQRASDLHLTVGLPPILRVDGVLRPLEGFQPLDDHALELLILALLSPDKQKILREEWEVDSSYAHKNIARFRVNAFFQKSHLSGSLRLIPTTIPSLKELQMPEIISSFCRLPYGLVLITGPTGQGKSTTLAAILQEINETRNVHIITIEDPIEYVFTPRKALITQREMHHDTKSWPAALRSALREDPNVVLIGEMRDFETIAAAITIAETGHLVFATLHTSSAGQSIDRIIDVFPESQQAQVRVQLSGILEAVVSQRLVPKISGGRVAAVEVMIANSAVRNIIREGKTHQIDNAITTGGEAGMISYEYSLANLVKSNLIAEEAALAATGSPQELTRILRRG